MKTLESLKQQVKNTGHQTVAVANAADKEVLRAVKTAIGEKLCSFQLFGQEEKIISLSKEIGLDISGPEIAIFHSEKHTETEAVKAVNRQEADILMKGNISTERLLKAVLNKDYGLRTGNVLSHVALFEIPAYDKLIFLTDAGMNIAPDLQKKTEIINNAVQVARGTGLDQPKVAVLAPVETVNQAISSTVDAAVLSQMQQKGQIKNCFVDGPLAFDLAVSAQAAEQKQIRSEVAGVADILMVPNIETGNALYKSFVYFAGGYAAGIVSGAKAPIVLASRADSAISKMYSLSLALVASKNF